MHFGKRCKFVAHAAIHIRIKEKPKYRIKKFNDYGVVYCMLKVPEGRRGGMYFPHRISGQHTKGRLLSLFCLPQSNVQTYLELGGLRHNEVKRL